MRHAALAAGSRRNSLIPTLIRVSALADRDLKGKTIPKEKSGTASNRRITMTDRIVNQHRCHQCHAVSGHDDRCQNCGYRLHRRILPLSTTPEPNSAHPPMPLLPIAQVAPQSRLVHHNVSRPKSAGIAILLNFLWLGAGQIYLSRVGTGICLAALEFFLWVLAVTVVGSVIAVPIWLVAFICAAISCTYIASHE